MDFGAIAQQMRLELSRMENLRLAAEALTQMGSVETAAKESAARLATTKEEEAKAKADLVAFRQKAVAEKGRVEAGLAAATAKAEQIVADAEARVAVLLKEAEGAIKARGEAAGHAYDKKASEIMAAIQDLERELAGKKAELVSTTAAVEAKVAEHGNVQQKVNELKAAAQRLLS